MPSLTRPPRKPLERDIQAEIRNALARRPEVRIWRNNVGALKDATGRTVRYGLCEGSADLVGCVTVTAAIQRMEAGVQTYSWGTLARLLCIEVKRPGQSPKPEQLAWLDVVRRAGGVAGVCHSVEEAEQLVDRALRWEI